MFAIMYRRTIVADVVQAIIVGGLLAFFTANHITANRIIGFSTLLLARTNSSGIVQAFFIGAALVYITTILILDDEVKAIQTTANGWNTIRQCNLPGNGILLRAACAKILPMANVVQEAMYWTTTVDSTGRALSGRRHYVLHFPAGQLPPNNAFWSLTMTDVRSYMVSNPINRYSVGGRSDLITGPGWKGQVPSGMTQISSPNNSVLVIGRVLVYSDSDLPTAYGLAKMIQLASLSSN